MPNWRRTLFALWVSQFMAMVGFSFIFPFMPLYIQTLGIEGVAQVAFWSGLCNSLGAVTMAVMAPIWGYLADRFGRKMMVLRSTFAAAIILTMMAYVANVQQLAILRVVQGALTGTMAASNTLVAAAAPEDRRGSALGSLQMGIFLGVTVGPLIGGASVDALGYEATFWISGLMMLIAGLIVLFLVRENFEPVEEGESGLLTGFGLGLKLMFAAGGVLGILLIARIVLRSASNVLSPVMALIVQDMSAAGSYTALLTGIVSSVAAVGGAFGAPIAGRLGDRYGQRRLLIVSSLAAAACFLPQTFVNHVGWLIFWQLLSGLGLGGMLASSMALLAEHTPHGHEGVVFGLDASAMGVSGAIGPMAGAAVVAGFGLRAPFVAATLLLVAGATFVVLGVRGTDGGGPASGHPRRVRWYARLRTRQQ